MTHEQYIAMCIEQQAARDASLAEAEPVELTPEEAVKLAAYLRYQAKLARKAFETGQVPAVGTLPHTLADGVHNGWVAGKARGGYSYGETRNDKPEAGPLTHPLMVPTADLSFSDLRYDIDTGANALLLIADALKKNDD